MRAQLTNPLVLTLWDLEQRTEPGPQGLLTYRSVRLEIGVVLSCWVCVICYVAIKANITCLSEIAVARNPYEASIKLCPAPSMLIAPITLDSQSQSCLMVQRSLAWLSLPCFLPLPSSHSIPAKLTSLLFHKHHKLTPTSGPLHLLFLLPGIHSSQLCTWFAYSFQFDLCSLSYPHGYLPWPPSLKFSKIPT